MYNKDGRVLLRLANGRLVGSVSAYSSPGSIQSFIDMAMVMEQWVSCGDHASSQ